MITQQTKVYNTLFCVIMEKKADPSLYVKIAYFFKLKVKKRKRFSHT